MRIGEFSKSNGVTIDTVRHYMDIGLLIPEKKGGQYFFSSQTNEDIAEILELKTLGFQLDEILNIMSFKRISSLKIESDMDYFINFFEKALAKKNNEKSQLEKVINLLLYKLDELNASNNEISKSVGFPLDFLQYLTCLECDDKLVLRTGNIENNMIMSGLLSSNCGNNLLVDSGYLKISETPYDPIREDPLLRQKYLNSIHKDYIKHIFKGINWITERIDFNKLSGKVVLELGVGWGMLLGSIIDRIPMECMYFAMDESNYAIKFSKELISKSAGKASIALISSRVDMIPIKDNSVDLIIDCRGSLNHNLKYRGFTFDIIKNKLKKGGQWLGAFHYFKKNSPSLATYDSHLREYFLLDNIKGALERCGFREVESMEQGYVDKGGKTFERHFLEGDKVYLWNYWGEKQ